MEKKLTGKGGAGRGQGRKPNQFKTSHIRITADLTDFLKDIDLSARAMLCQPGVDLDRVENVLLECRQLIDDANKEAYLKYNESEEEEEEEEIELIPIENFKPGQND